VDMQLETRINGRVEDLLGTPQGAKKGKKDLEGKSWARTGSRRRSNWRIVKTLVSLVTFICGARREAEKRCWAK